MKPLLLLLFFVAAFLAIACFKSPAMIPDGSKNVEVENMTLKITSPQFVNNTLMPRKYTCQGHDINPPLSIDGIPSNAKSLALILDDPDAPMGTWDHWIIWNIPIISRIEEDGVPNGAIQGLNSWGNNSYGGPCPPTGTHRYFFKVYALDNVLNLDPQSDKKTLEKAMQNHILSKGELIGLYRKS